MDKRKKIFLLWLILVIVWNFGFPTAKPIYDVGAALFLSMLSIILNKKSI
tara:strand:- start:287 stop:436 length:150 start_codon:yes stop_codon:yes gene_type:complete